jgi:hypothetical protein
MVVLVLLQVLLELLLAEQAVAVEELKAQLRLVLQRMVEALVVLFLLLEQMALQTQVAVAVVTQTKAQHRVVVVLVLSFSATLPQGH